jgi:hypothetical protein
MVMKEKINIAKILKDKPRGTKLYSSACGKCKLEEVDDKSFKISFYNSKFGFMNGGEGYLDKNGKLYDDGECVVFPSKEMRDWEKFAWKRGDVLVNSRGLKILFDRWANDNYTSFYAKTINLVEDGFLDTNLHTLASEKEAKSFIKCIEEKLGGKLNRETLEVEKTQPEFKDGDIVFMKGIKSGYYANCIFILRSEYKDGDERAFYYAFYNTDDKFTIAEYGYTRIHYSLRLATDSEKQQLFDALAKKGKRWDIEKKQIVDLKPKCEFKPFDKVLGRNEKDDVWEAELFSHYREESQYPFRCIGFSRKYCIPYNEDTAHLLGTTDDWEGGEQ